MAGGGGGLFAEHGVDDAMLFNDDPGNNALCGDAPDDEGGGGGGGASWTLCSNGLPPNGSATPMALMDPAEALRLMPTAPPEEVPGFIPRAAPIPPPPPCC